MFNLDPYFFHLMIMLFFPVWESVHVILFDLLGLVYFRVLAFFSYVPLDEGRFQFELAFKQVTLS